MHGFFQMVRKNKMGSCALSCSACAPGHLMLV